jgi:hypothetical protein
MTRDYFTIFRSATLPWRENDISRRYLHILEKWAPIAIAYYADWPVRPNSGHFFGGCSWYGEETCAPAFAFAFMASSPEYDARMTGLSRHEIRQMAYRGLRYACFTHDTGPADCVRPAKGLGRSENWGTKWGERGKGFFMESQCGVTLGKMAITALLLADLIDDETWAMLQAIYLDYAERFGTMEPRSGVYVDTQMEENMWTSLGLSSVGLMLGHHPQSETWLANARRWMFLAVATPQDAKNQAKWDESTTVSELVYKTFTTLPDYMAENHGMVHPSYTATALSFSGMLATLFRAFSLPLPKEALYNRQEINQVLKRMTDHSGSLHPVQGMDWPYLTPGFTTMTFSAATLLLQDADAARLELWALQRMEQCQQSNEGRLFNREIAEKVSNIQDPLIIWESFISELVFSYGAHRQLGTDLQPTPEAQLEQKLGGVKLFPHSGFIFNRHPTGQTSFSWRNTIMALPLNKDGLYTIAPATNSLLAQFQVHDKPGSQRQVSLAIDDYRDRFAVNLVMDRAQGSVRQRVLFASLPNGMSLLLERLNARCDITIDSMKQGFMRIINENYPAIPDNCHGQRTLYTEQGAQVFRSYVSTDPQSDIHWQASDLGWLNIDDRMGIVYQAEGPTTYLNRHYYNPWWAVADDLVLSQQPEARTYLAGQQIAELVAMITPDQSHEQTAVQDWQVLRDRENDAVGILAGGYLAVANWSEGDVTAEFTLPYQAGNQLSIPVGKTQVTSERITYQVPIKGGGAGLHRVATKLSLNGTLEFIADELGHIWIHNNGNVRVELTRECCPQSVTLDAGEFLII